MYGVSQWLKNFTAGVVGVFLLRIRWVFEGHIHWTDAIVKWLGLGLMAAAGGLLTALGADIYKLFLKPRVAWLKITMYVLVVRVKNKFIKPKKKQDASRPDQTDSGTQSRVG